MSAAWRWSLIRHIDPCSKVHGTNTGPTWVLSAPDGPHIGPMNLAIRGYFLTAITPRYQISWSQHGAHLGPIGPRWAPCWPHEPCSQGPNVYPCLVQLDHECRMPLIPVYEGRCPHTNAIRHPGLPAMKSQRAFLYRIGHSPACLSAASERARVQSYLKRCFVWNPAWHRGKIESFCCDFADLILNYRVDYVNFTDINLLSW